MIQCWLHNNLSAYCILHRIGISGPTISFTRSPTGEVYKILTMYYARTAHTLTLYIEVYGTDNDALNHHLRQDL